MGRGEAVEEGGDKNKTKETKNQNTNAGAGGKNREPGGEEDRKENGAGEIVVEEHDAGGHCPGQCQYDV